MGYNGVPSGHFHCEDYFEKEISYHTDYIPSLEEYFKSQEFLDEHKKWSEEHEIHAEMNAIAFAAKNGISTNGSEIYVTHSPCFHCAKVIIQSGIKKVYFRNIYNVKVVKFLEHSGLEVIQI